MFWALVCSRFITKIEGYIPVNFEASYLANTFQGFLFLLIAQIRIYIPVTFQLSYLTFCPQRLSSWVDAFPVLRNIVALLSFSMRNIEKALGKSFVGADNHIQDTNEYIDGRAAWNSFALKHKTNASI